MIVAGGMAANRRLRSRFAEAGLCAHFPPLSLATDNGAMIALAAQERLSTPSPWSVDAAPYLPLAHPASASS